MGRRRHQSPDLVAELHRTATRIRLSATRMVAIQGFGYLGQALSSAEIFAVLFCGDVLRHGHDRFVLSPAHYAIALYAAAVEAGLLERDELDTYGRDGTRLEAIATERTPVADLVCGSLGQGLSGAVGLALASYLADEDRVTYALLSDGEMEEGQIWEAAMFASHHRHRMGALRVVVDANDSQVDGPVTSVTTIEPLADKWRAFGWHVADVDGHDAGALLETLTGADDDRTPSIVIARTHILGRTRAIPQAADGHFITLDGDLARALTAELEAALA